MNTGLRKEENMLLALLRAALKEEKAETAPFERLTEEDWIACRRLAVKQGVMAIALDGALTLPEELQPPQEFKLKWAMAVEKLERKYERYCQAIARLSEIYARHGIMTTQMKGVALSTSYPRPEHREGGDIDIYTYSMDRSRMSDEEANALADKIMEEHGIEVDGRDSKHSSFYYKGIPFENHKHFLNVASIRIAGPIDAALKRCKLDRYVTLMDGKYAIHTPDDTFNTLFIAFHTAQHYGSGIALHHLCDWACILNRHGLQLPEDVNDPHFLKIVCLLTRFTNRYLGTDIKNLPGEIKEDDAEDRRLFNEIFRGNYVKHYASRNPIKILAHKTGRFFHVAAIHRSIFGTPVCLSLWRSIVAHLRKPGSILAT